MLEFLFHPNVLVKSLNLSAWIENNFSIDDVFKLSIPLSFFSSFFMASRLGIIVCEVTLTLKI